MTALGFAVENYVRTNFENNYQDAVTAQDVQDAPAKGKGTVKPSLLNETLSKGEQTTADTLAVLSGEPGRIGAFLDQAGANPAHGKDERVPSSRPPGEEYFCRLVKSRGTS